MEKKIRTYLVKPLNGLKVPNPSTGVFLEEKGEVVEASSYWTRRIDAKEVSVSQDSSSQPLQNKTIQNQEDKVNATASKDSSGGK